MPFVQLHGNFGPKNMERLVPFFQAIPKDMKVAVEFRHTDWFNDEVVANELYDILERFNVSVPHVRVETRVRVNTTKSKNEACQRCNVDTRRRELWFMKVQDVKDRAS